MRAMRAILVHLFLWPFNEYKKNLRLVRQQQAVV